MRIRHVMAALCFASCPIFSAGAAAAGDGVIDEMRFGVFQHDTGIVGLHKEAGVDYVFETLSRPITALSLIGSPRLVIGGALNSAGKTDQIYAGLSAQWNFVHSVFSRHDSFFLEGNLGGSWNDGKLDVRGTPLESSWKSHGSHLLFRIGPGIGYHFNRTWSLTLNFNHVSNAHLARRNEGMNDIGLILGIKL